MAKSKCLFWIFAFTCISYIDCVPIQEHRCSKFDFEEKVLEKMVRMEHSTELMMKEFKGISDGVQNSLETMKQEFESMKHQAEEDSENYTTMMNELKGTSAGVQNNLETMKRDFEDIKHQAEEEREKYTTMVQDYLDRSSYAFSAYWLQDHSPDPGDTLIFNSTYLNENYVYNKYTGEYTVKLTGTYTFSATLCFGGKKHADIEFVANGKSLGKFRAGDPFWNLCSSSSATAVLQKNMKVKLIVRDRYQTNAFWDDPTIALSSFSGHLIR